MTLQLISAEEIIQFHDRLLRVTPGVTGMPDPGRAEALMYRVLKQIEYEGVTDVWLLQCICSLYPVGISSMMVTNVPPYLLRCCF